MRRGAKILIMNKKDNLSWVESASITAIVDSDSGKKFRVKIDRTGEEPDRYFESGKEASMNITELVPDSGGAE